MAKPPHEVLGVPENATRAEIDEAYRTRLIYANPKSFAKGTSEREKARAHCEELMQAYDALCLKPTPSNPKEESAPATQLPSSLTDSSIGLEDPFTGLGCLFQLGLSFLYLSVIAQGIEEWLGIWWFFSFLLGYILASIPLAGTVIAIVSAIKVWNWGVFYSIVVFGVLPLTMCFVFGGLAELFKRYKKRGKHLSKRKRLFFMYVVFSALETIFVVAGLYYFDDIDIAVNLETLFGLLFIYIAVFFLYLICTAPTLLVRFLILRQPIVKDFNAFLVASFLMIVGKTIAGGILGYIANDSDYTLKSGALLFLFVNYFLLIFGRAEREE